MPKQHVDFVPATKLTQLHAAIGNYPEAADLLGLSASGLRGMVVNNRTRTAYELAAEALLSAMDISEPEEQPADTVSTLSAEDCDVQAETKPIFHELPEEQEPEFLSLVQVVVRDPQKMHTLVNFAEYVLHISSEQINTIDMTPAN